jgi:hypothetical protein
MGILQDVLFGQQQRPAVASSATAGSVSPDRLAIGRKIYNYFVAQGLAPHQAAAIAGNMAWEGGGRVDLVNPGDNWRNSPRSPHSVGIGQWNDRAPALIEFARRSGVDIPGGDMRDAGYMREVIKRIPLETQLGFAWQEMQGSEGRALGQIRSAQDLRGATAGAIGYHRPAGWTRHNPEAGHGFSGRMSIAQRVLDAAKANPQPPDGLEHTAYTTQPAPAEGAASGQKSPPVSHPQEIANGRPAAQGSGIGGGLLGAVGLDKIFPNLGKDDQDAERRAAIAAATAAAPMGPELPVLPPMRIPGLDPNALARLALRRRQLGTEV